jgi:hypothetical protein
MAWYLQSRFGEETKTWLEFQTPFFLPLKFVHGNGGGGDGEQVIDIDRHPASTGTPSEEFAFVP